jgi:histone deacetylase complex regulatory component SIN3|uniref:Uncharacterized protein n=1 Tax=Fagus sylvatica TaxID=28930 RepID=A0A2N9J5S2_FAGSY
MNSNNNEEGMDSCKERGLVLFKKIQERLSSGEAYLEFLELVHLHSSEEIELEPVLDFVRQSCGTGLADELRDFAEFCQTKLNKDTEEEGPKHDSVPKS